VTTRQPWGTALLFSTLFAGAVAADDLRGGGLVGWVQNTEGLPIAGAVISVFGKGITGGGLVTLTDSAGQFILPSLPPGSYTLRALGRGHEPSIARQVTVVPDRDSLTTLSLMPIGETAVSSSAVAAEEAPSTLSNREVRWLMRHKRRSVLEDREAGPIVPNPDGETPPADTPREAAAPLLPDLAGTVEVLTNPTNLDGTANDAVPTSSGLVRLRGHFADSGEWTLGGLVTDNESRTWRMAGEVVVDPASGHELRAGLGYGTRSTVALGAGDVDAALDRRSAGAIFVRDKWRVIPALSATVEVRYAYIGLLEDQNYVDPSASLEYRAGPLTHIRGSATMRTLTPGGDLLTLSGIGSGPSVALVRLDPGLRAERTRRGELEVDRAVGATTVGAQLFYESVQDQLLNVYEGRAQAPSLRILNGGQAQAQGVGVSVSHHWGDAVSGSVAYTFGRSSREADGLEVVRGAVVPYHDADFHDVVARVDTFIEGTDTHVSAYYRINALMPETDSKGTNHVLTNTRFDIQLNQGLPFLQGLTRAEWGVLVAVRNLFYESSEAATLDEIVVLRPPKRVLGGISVRF
jgi:hypothetical protein